MDRPQDTDTLASAARRFALIWGIALWVIVLVLLWSVAQVVGYLFPLGLGLAMAWGWVAFTHAHWPRTWPPLVPPLLLHLAAAAYAGIAVPAMDLWDAFFHVGHLVTVVVAGLLLTYSVRQLRQLPSEARRTVLASALISVCTLLAMLGLYWAGQDPSRPPEGPPSAVAAIYAVAIALAIGLAWILSAAVQAGPTRRVQLAAGALAVAFMSATFFPLEFFGNCAETFLPYTLC